jgi:hypothetical protein
MKKKILRVALVMMGVVVLGGMAIGISACAAMGTAADGKRLQRMQASPQWKDGRFDNELERVDGDMTEML